MKNCILLFSILILSACNIKTDKIQSLQSESVNLNTFPKIINIERDFNNRKEFHLSEIAADIEYVKLEKTTESLAGGGNPSWYITRSFIFVFSQRKLLQFDRKGKFIQQFGRNGRGPGEFQSMKGIVADELKNILYVIANYKNVVFKYDLITGEFLGNFPINEYLGSPLISNSIQMIAQDTFIVLTHSFAKFKPDYSIFDSAVLNIFKFSNA